MLLKNINVLVVDDVILMCDFLYSAAARMSDCRAFKALDGKAALDILEKESIDLLITDLEIGEPTGLELIAKVRSGALSHTAHDIPILVFSGNAYLKTIQQCISFGINDFLVKPLSVKGLQDKIHHHLATEKLLKPADYYQTVYNDLLAPSAIHDAETEHKVRAAIVRDLPVEDELLEEQLAGRSDEARKRDFLVWPETATTGYFQLDRRLRNLAFHVSCFHNVVINNCKTVALESERKRACQAIGFLLHIVKNFQGKTERPEFWVLFQQRIEKLLPMAAALSAINIKHHREVLTLLKNVLYWWMQTCNRPIIQRNEDESN